MKKKRRKKKDKKYYIFLALIAIFAVICCVYMALKNEADSHSLVSESQIASQTVESVNSISADNLPQYNGKAFVAVNNNEPAFDKTKSAKAFESYSKLDYLRRCRTAFACVGKETMPKEKRGDISSVKPSGWVHVEYDFIDGKSLYNRCHLIGYQLTAENANERNLITGTRYMNTEGMLPIENMVADYIKETNNHVLYSVTPIFKGKEPLARGVQIQAYSVEDKGEGICCNVFCFNVQPGIEINYSNSKSTLLNASSTTTTALSGGKYDYILNIRSKKFHKTDCDGAKDISPSNKEDYKGSRDALIQQGYSPCGRCNP